MKYSNSTILPPVTTNLQELPFNQLTWGNFEHLCLKLVEKEYTIEDCERYGVAGEEQEGIDIFARDKEGKYSTYQCKRWKKFTPSNITQIIEDFQKGKFYPKSHRFVICTSLPLNTTTLQNRIEEEKDKLAERNIQLIKWDSVQLNRILKKHPDIVGEIFGPYWQKEFNGETITETSLLLEEIKSQLKSISGNIFAINNHIDNFPDAHIERKETNEIISWIETPLSGEKTNIAVLTGKPGCGKTVIIKDILQILNEKNIPVLGLKADKDSLLQDNISMSLGFETNIRTIFNHLTKEDKTAVVLIDQIDALSQSLSTNRQQINVYTSFINQLSTIPNIRIVISCRKFDLHHDVELRQYTNKKEFSIDIFSEKELETILIRTINKKINEFPTDLIELIRTPLHLNIFCRIFTPKTPVHTIKNLQDLYRELWLLKVTNNSLSNLLYDIADRVYKDQENLCTSVKPFDNQYFLITYLKSENLIVEDKGKIQFFHQTFYDYTYARAFIERAGGEIYEFLSNKHQGLFIRSMVKQVLSYLREYNPEIYKNQINKILYSDKIRYHIKTLVTELLSYEEKPTKDDFSAISGLISHEQSLVIRFFETTISPYWFQLFYWRKNILPDLLNNSEENMVNAVGNFVVRNGAYKPELTIDILNNIHNKDLKFKLTRWFLFRTRRYDLSIVIQTYYTISTSITNNDRLHILENASGTNPEFTMKEAWPILEKALKTASLKVNKRRDQEERQLFHFCETFYKNNPTYAYFFFKEITNKLICENIREETIFYTLKQLKEDLIFSSYNPEEKNYHKFLKWMVDYLSSNIESNSEFVTSEVNNYLQSQFSTHPLIAFLVINSHPNLFQKEIYKILTNPILTKDCLKIKDLKYLYRKLIEENYLLFTENQQQNIIDFIFDFYPEHDRRPSPDYRKLRRQYPLALFYPYPKLGFSQWLLLNSVPTEVILKNQILKYRLNQLNRRYSEKHGYEKTNKKPFYGVKMAGVCGGYTSPKNYRKWKAKHWYNSFIKLEIKQHELHMDIELHATEFKETVKQNPIKYASFVTALIQNNKVHVRYQIKGLKGLMEADYDLPLIRQLYSQLMNRDLKTYHLFPFVQMGSWFIAQTKVDSDLLNYWLSLIDKPLEKEEQNYRQSTETPLLDEVHNTINTVAIDLLIKLSNNKEYQDLSFQQLKEMSTQLPIQLKLKVLSCLNEEGEFTTEELLELFLLYTTEVNSETLLISQYLFNHLLYHNFKKMQPFIEKTIQLPESSHLLGAYLLYGWLYGNEESKEYLFRLHKDFPQSIPQTIQQACETYSLIQYKEKCHFILEKYSYYTDKEIRDAYEHGFYQFTPADFKQIRPLIDAYCQHINEERAWGLYHYLLSCVKQYPLECIQIQKSISGKKIFNNSYDMKEPIELLTAAYNTINKYDDSEEIEYIMDTFDELLKNTCFHIEIDNILKDLET